MVKHCLASVLLVTMLSVGCDRGETMAERQEQGDGATQRQNYLGVRQDAFNQDLDDANAATSLEPTVTRAELQTAIDRHRDESNWHFSERPDGFPSGRWLAQDDSQAPLVFGPDGSFECPFGGTDQTPGTARGIYAISDNGLVVAVARGNGAALSVFYRLENGSLYGSKGPKPRVEWRRTPTTE